MNKKKKIYILLGILAVAILITIGVSFYETATEKIKATSDVIIAINSEDVNRLSFTGSEEVITLYKKEDNWKLENYEDFPVDNEKVENLLNNFKDYKASFTIENVSQYNQYGLLQPQNTIEITTDEDTYTLMLGDFSTMDSQRYVSTYDTNVYLAIEDIYDDFNITKDDLMKNDEIPDLSNIKSFTLTGDEELSAEYIEDNTITLSAEDKYFTKQNGKMVALDTNLVNSYMDKVEYLNFTDYGTYNLSESEKEEFGLNKPVLSTEIVYLDKDKNEQSFSFVIGLNQEELKLKEEATENNQEYEDAVTSYIRIGNSDIVYVLPTDTYDFLMGYTYNDLRHQQLLYYSLDSIKAFEISLDDVNYTITKSDEKDDNDENIWYLNDEQVDVTDIYSKLTSITATSFDTNTGFSKKEISVKVLYDSDTENSVDIGFYRIDGNSCLGCVNDNKTAIVSRDLVVELTEAVNKVVLK